MREVNVLFLSAGRRVELIQFFREAVEELGMKSKLVAADITETAPAIYFADTFYMIPKIYHEKHIDSIIDICKKEDIHLIIPTIDTELLKLAENKEYIEQQTNAKVLVSDLDVINICRNKINTQLFFEKYGFGVPKLISQEDVKNKNYTLPLFIKPLNGSSSKNTFKVTNEQELHFFNKYIDYPMIQQFIEGEEFTVDTFLDFDSNIISIVPRKRLATRDGEISKGIIVKDEEIIAEVRAVLEALKPIGHITVQCMKTTDGIKFIEINPRFGGGAPMSIKAGANSPAWLYRLLSGEQLSYQEEYEENLLCLRYDDAVFINDEGKVLA